MRRRRHHGSEVRREGEERAGHGLGSAIAGEEDVVADPAGGHDGLAQQGQDHMAAPEHQRARPVEGLEQREALGCSEISPYRQRHEQQQENGEGRQPDRARDGHGHVAGRCLRRRTTEPQAGHAPQRDGQDLGARGRADQDDQGRHHRDRRALAVGAERAGHAPDGLGDDRHGHELEAVQEAGPQRSLKRARAMREEDEGDRGGQRESCPRREAAEIARPHEPEGKTDLATRGAGQELAETDEIGVGMLVEPAPPHDELFAEIPDMGDGPAKAAHAELAEGEEHFEGTGPPLLAHARGTRAELWRNAAAFRRSPAGRGRRRAVPWKRARSSSSLMAAIRSAPG